MSRFFFWTMAAIFSISIGASSVFAQRDNIQWSEPERVLGTDDRSHYYYGLVPDATGRVHLFWSQGDNEVGHSIFYSYWDDRNWSIPVDVLLSPIGGASNFLDALIDENGTIHLLFFGGNENDGRLYYTHAPVLQAGSALEWSKPFEIADSAGPSGSIGLDATGAIQVLYTGLGQPQLYSTSSDGGETWSTPTLLYESAFVDHTIIGTNMITDPSGIHHASWSLFDGNAFGQTVYYARFDPNNGQWTQPVEIAVRDPEDFGVGYSSLAAVDESTILIIYQDGSPPKRNFRMSVDGGATWSEPQEVFGVVGQNGVVGPMTVDGDGNLHVVTHGRYNGIGNSEVHGMFYFPWLGDRWGSRSPIAEGLKTNEYDPQNPALVSYGGNKLLVVYGNDPARGLWYSVAVTDATAFEPRPYPTVSVSASVEEIASIAAVSPVLQSTPQAIELTQPPTTQNDQSITWPLLIGVSAAAIPILIILLIRVSPNRHRNR